MIRGGNCRVRKVPKYLIFLLLFGQFSFLNMNYCFLLVVDNLVLDIYIKFIVGSDYKKDVEDDDDENEYEDMYDILRAAA